MTNIRIAEGLFDSKVLVGLDRKTGKQLWTRTAQDRFNHHALAIGGGLVFCVDSSSNKKTGEMKRRGNPPKTLNSTVLALQPRTGSVKWHKVFENPFVHYGDEFGPVQSNDDALFYSEQCDVLVVYKDRRYRAISGADGETLWEKDAPTASFRLTACCLRLASRYDASATIPWKRRSVSSICRLPKVGREPRPYASHYRWENETRRSGGKSKAAGFILPSSLR